MSQSRQATIVITGAGRGIGAATALLAAQSGYQVCINYHRDDRAAESVREKIQRMGGVAVVVAADITSESEVIHMFDTVEQQLGGITALVNNAGILHQQTRLEAMTVERVRHVLEVNVLGSFLCAREAIRRMSSYNGGSGGAIVNVSSRASQLGSPGEYIDYAASKGAIDTLTVGLAKEVADQGIRVNAVRPGIINTDIHARGGEPDRVERLKGSVPLQRAGEADEVANAILWLLSDSAAYVTGSILDVAGGR